MLLLRCHLLLTFRHRAGVRPYTSSFDFAKPCVFVKQSPGPFLCASPGGEGPLSRSYRAILPSSLATDHSSAFGFSPRPPVSVSGTGRRGHTLEVFLGSMFGTAVRSPEGPRYFHLQKQPADLPTGLSYKLQRTYPSVRGSFTSPSLLRFHVG